VSFLLFFVLMGDSRVPEYIVKKRINAQEDDAHDDAEEETGSDEEE